MAKTMRIAMLNADVPVPNVIPKWGTWGQIFHALLSSAASRIAPGIRIESTDYYVKEQEYPKSLSEVDVLLISGSACSAYDDEEWIRRLDRYILEVHTNHPRIKIFGSCFGHQIMCQSLLKGYGVRVEKDPNGWELGVKEVKIDQAFRKILGKSATNNVKAEFPGGVTGNMRLQMVHSDHVRFPGTAKDVLPSSWMTVGRTEHCAVQGVYEPGRILTLQGHFEFDRFVNTEVLKVVGANWDPQFLKETLEAIDADDDAGAAAEMILLFLLEEQTDKANTGHDVVKGLMTPPLQA